MAAGVNAGGHAQHHAGALAEPFRNRGDACGLVRRIDHDFREALGNGEFDLLIALVVAVQHQSTTGNAGGERDLHLAERAGVDEHAFLGHNARHFLREERLGGIAHMRGVVRERVCGGLHEVAGAGTHLVEIQHVQGRAEFVEQGAGGDAVERELAVGIPGRVCRPDWTDGHIHLLISFAVSSSFRPPLFPSPPFA